MAPNLNMHTYVCIKAVTEIAQLWTYPLRPIDPFAINTACAYILITFYDYLLAKISMGTLRNNKYSTTMGDLAC